MAGKKDQITIISIISDEKDREARIKKIYEKLYDWVMEKMAHEVDTEDGNKLKD